ncbi:hypothetical protein VBD025_12040 [Virgibacillus flavescens]|uniref:hypothetical protein n=1 Tax=Virgibacillus flavescens TaxID=1611422 RepID=UPI003D34E22B
MDNYCIQDLFTGKQLEIVAAYLLLSGKLKVESVEIFTNEPIVSVNLIGQYKGQNKQNESSLFEFMKENNMTPEDVLQVFNNRKGD